MKRSNDTTQPEEPVSPELRRVMDAAQAAGEMRATESIGARVMKKRYFRPLINDEDGGHTPQDKGR